MDKSPINICAGPEDTLSYVSWKLMIVLINNLSLYDAEPVYYRHKQHGNSILDYKWNRMYSVMFFKSVLKVYLLPA
jgi:hypothetical protein